MIKASKTFNRILKLTLGIYLKKKFNVSFADRDGVKGLEPPYIVLANHTNFWDPFIMSVYINDPIYFVTSDEYFRNFALRMLLKLVGGIPKTKFVSDAATINSAIRVVRKYKGIVGIYPEGRRNWDGKTLPAIFPTAKLVKAFNVPVVTALSKGASLSYPRWAAKPRKGRLDIEYRILADKDEIRSLSVEELYDRINTYLMHDEYEYQSKKMTAYKGRRLAESIELFLYTCPSCRHIGTLASQGAVVRCGSCGYNARYNKFGFFEEIRGSGRTDAGGTDLVFDNTHDWDLWQTENLNELLSGQYFPIFEDSGVMLMTGTKMSPMADYGIGSLSLHCRKNVFVMETGEMLEFDYSKMTGVNVQHRNQFEFYYDKKLCKFIFRPGVSAYKWVKAYELSENRIGG